jgi:hypothetical protein
LLKADRERHGFIAKQARSEMVTLVSGMGEDLKWATIEICALPLFSLVHL